MVPAAAAPSLKKQSLAFKERRSYGLFIRAEPRARVSGPKGRACHGFLGSHLRAPNDISIARTVANEKFPYVHKRL